MRYLSVCSGIEAATVAWHNLGWTPVGFSEIEPFPSAVLAHHYPNVPNFGDMTQHDQWPLQPGSIDLLVGGTPCQSFSVAGLRKGLHDPRGGLMLTYLEIARRLRPRWVVWENVPGVLSSNGGRDFGSFLGAMGELGYGVAYRVLDAQWCRTHGHPRAVPQRRRRVFVVGCLGDWERAAQVLFECESVQRDSAPRRTTRQGAASDAEGCVGTVSSKWAKGTGGYAGVNEHENLTTWPAQISCTLNARFGDKLGLEDQHALHGAPLFVPAVVGALTAKGPGGLGAPEVDAQHYLVERPTWWNGDQVAETLTKSNAGGAQRMPDKDNFGAIIQPITVRSGSIGGFVQDDVGGTMRAKGGDYHGGSESLVMWPADVAATLDRSSKNSGSPSGSNQEIFSQHGANLIPQPVPFTKSKRAQSVTDDETWVDGQVNPTLSLFDQGDTRATTVAVAFPINTLTLGGRPDAVNDKRMTMGVGENGDPQFTLQAAHGHAVAHAFYSTGGTHGVNQQPEVSPAVKVGSGLGIPSPPAVAQAMTVRRLTPRECERLQGFPDDYTLIPWRKKAAADCPDGPRYKALGNSMAVNCMAWIGERIAAVDAEMGTKE